MSRHGCTAATTRARFGFTLVELLVVVSIISVLIAILLPALTKARQAAISLQCLSVLRQLHNNMLAYAANSRGMVPTARESSTGRFAGEIYADTGFPEMAPTNTRMHCPARPGITYDPTRVSNLIPPYWLPLYTPDLRYRKLSTVRRPAEKIAWVDAPRRDPYSEFVSPNYYVGTWSEWRQSLHGKGPNAIFFDGHGEQFTPSELTAGCAFVGGRMVEPDSP